MRGPIPTTTTLSEKIEAILKAAMGVRAPYTQLIGTHEQETADKERLDFIDVWIRHSPTGVSLDWALHGGGEPGGYRFMRQHYISAPCATLRDAIDAQIRRDRENGLSTAGPR